MPFPCGRTSPDVCPTQAVETATYDETFAVLEEKKRGEEVFCVGAVRFAGGAVLGPLFPPKGIRSPFSTTDLSHRELIFEPLFWCLSLPGNFFSDVRAFIQRNFPPSIWIVATLGNSKSLQALFFLFPDNFLQSWILYESSQNMG